MKDANATIILSRLVEAVGAKTDAALAQAIDISLNLFLTQEEKTKSLLLGQ